MQVDPLMLNSYRKYENRMLIDKTFAHEKSLKAKIDNLVNNFRWDKVFISELMKYVYKQTVQKYNLAILGVGYLLLYILHWFFVGDKTGQSIVTMLFHLCLIFIGLNLFYLMRAGSGFINKKHITKDR